MPMTKRELEERVVELEEGLEQAEEALKTALDAIRGLLGEEPAGEDLERAEEH